MATIIVSSAPISRLVIWRTAISAIAPATAWYTIMPSSRIASGVTARVSPPSGTPAPSRNAATSVLTSVDGGAAAGAGAACSIGAARWTGAGAVPWAEAQARE